MGLFGWVAEVKLVDIIN